MLPVEKEMIGLLVKGAYTPLENIQVSFFLVAWSALVLGALRMVRYGKETERFIQAGSFHELAQDFASRCDDTTKTGSRPGGRKEKADRRANPTFKRRT